MQLKILMGNQCAKKCIKDNDASHHEQWQRQTALCVTHNCAVYLNNTHFALGHMKRSWVSFT
jgi:hypothetical protein